MNRRGFLGAACGLAGLGVASPALALPRLRNYPRLTFYGSTQQVSGSCHILECSKGLFLVDCGLFYPDIPNRDQENREFPFDPKEVKALLLTHAHVDHIGRLPVLVERGFKGKVYCTDATRDLVQAILEMVQNTPGETQVSSELFSKEACAKLLKSIEAISYNTRMEREGLLLRYTDAGHLLGSAMIEVWVDDVKLLFSGDMGPDFAPILCKPTQHFGADAVLVESTYGPTARDTINFDEFGKKIQKVIEGGGSVLLPAFAMHKSQCLIYVLHKLRQDRIIKEDVPIISDSATAQKCTELYQRYKEYHDPDAKKFGTLFYRDKYREMSSKESLKLHDNKDYGPAIFISTSGMLDHATAPKHFIKMAGEEKNAIFLVGYQAPDSVGSRVQKGDKRIQVPWESEEGGEFKRVMKDVDVKLQVMQQKGFSSHARGQQILEWLGGFKKGVGQVCFVHGDKEKATGMADAAKKMNVEAIAPKRNDTIVIKPQRSVAGAAPTLPPALSEGFSPVDR